MINEMKDELLDYAIKRINEYDRFDNRPDDKLDTVVLSRCLGCTLANENCSICPFNFASSTKVNLEDDSCNKNIGCRGYRLTDENFCETAYREDTAVKMHQKRLMRAVRKWCKRFYPEFTIEVIK